MSGRRPWGDEKGFRQQTVRRYLPPFPDPEAEEREQAWADLKTAVQEVVVPPLEAIVRFLTRVIDRLTPDRHFERGLGTVGANVGRALDGLAGWFQENPEVLAFALEVQEWEAKAAALGAEEGLVERLVEDAAAHAAASGVDPMAEARARWDETLRKLTMGHPDPYSYPRFP